MSFPSLFGDGKAWCCSQRGQGCRLSKTFPKIQLRPKAGVVELGGTSTTTPQVLLDVSGIASNFRACFWAEETPGLDVLGHANGSWQLGEKSEEGAGGLGLGHWGHRRDLLDPAIA